MAEGILRPPIDLNGSAGIFLERAGNRKMAMGGGRLVLPRLFPFQQKNRPLEEEGDILRRNGAKQAPGAYVSGDHAEPPSKSAESFATCSQCGTSQQWLQDGPFHCPYCEVQKSGDIVVGSDLSRDLTPVEEGDRSEMDEEVEAGGRDSPTGSSSPSRNNMRHSPNTIITSSEEQRPDTPGGNGTVRMLSNLVRRISGGRRSRSGSSEEGYAGHDAPESNSRETGHH